MNNFMHLTDGYKLDHRRQYPEGTEFVLSNFTARSSRIEGQTHVTFFGLQHFLEKYLTKGAFDGFFVQSRTKVLKKYQEMLDSYFAPNHGITVDHIGALWDLGYLPLRFCALPEGTAVPLNVPMFTIENTKPEFFWLTNYFETLISSVLWITCTSATTAARYRKILDAAAITTTGNKDGVQWQGHDFSFRGMPGPEAAALSGIGHLLFFTGTDCLPAIDLLRDYYAGEGCIGGSVPATEHAVMCASGQDGELETYDRILNLYPTGIVSAVSDTWDLWGVITKILPKLHDKIMARDGRLVIRPDSGDPVKIICGDLLDEPFDSPARKGVVQLLWDEFGGTINSKGKKVLDSHIGAIYGDSITEARALEICIRLERNGFASTNIVFGIGSYTYQYVTRDTHSIAIKATCTQRNGIEHEMQKDPVTGIGKKSAKGRLAVVMENIRWGDLILLDGEMGKAFEKTPQNLLKCVWENGKFIHKTTLIEVRAIAEKSLKLSWLPR